jgi:GGDEF domain-containing protein
MSSTTAATFPPRIQRATRSLWSQRWPLLLSAVAVLFSGHLALVTKAVVLLGSLVVTGLSYVARGNSRAQAGGDSSLSVAESRRAGAESIPATERWASNRAALYELGDTMVEESVRSDQPMSVVVFEQVDLPELHAIFGSAAAHRVVAEFGARLKLLAAPGGVAVRTDATSWAVLLPGHDNDTAMAAVKRALGKSLAVEADAGEDEILLVPRIAMHTVGNRVASMRSIYRELREKIQRSHEHELLRQDYLRRERESHSRPARLEELRALVPATR